MYPVYYWGYTAWDVTYHRFLGTLECSAILWSRLTREMPYFSNSDANGIFANPVATVDGPWTRRSLWVVFVLLSLVKWWHNFASQILSRQKYKTPRLSLHTGHLHSYSPRFIFASGLYLKSVSPWSLLQGHSGDTEAFCISADSNSETCTFTLNICMRQYPQMFCVRGTSCIGICGCMILHEISWSEHSQTVADKSAKVFACHPCVSEDPREYLSFLSTLP